MRKVFVALLLGAMIGIFTACDEPTKTDVWFAILISDITASCATVSVTPQPASTVYYYDVASMAELNELGTEGLAQAYFTAILDDWTEYKEDYIAEGYTSFADAYLSKGEESYPYEYMLEPETEFVAFAFAVDTLTNTIGAVEVLGFYTTEVRPSDNSIVITSDSTSLTFLPTNDDPYYWTAYLTDTVTAYGAEALWQEEIELFQMLGLLSWGISFGTETWTLSDYFEEVGNYTIIAAGWDGGRTTDFFTYQLDINENQIGTDSESALAMRKMRRPASARATVKHHQLKK